MIIVNNSNDYPEYKHLDVVICPSGYQLKTNYGLIYFNKVDELTDYVVKNYLSK